MSGPQRHNSSQWQMVHMLTTRTAGHDSQATQPYDEALSVPTVQSTVSKCISSLLQRTHKHVQFAGLAMPPAGSAHSVGQAAAPPYCQLLSSASECARMPPPSSRPLPLPAAWPLSAAPFACQGSLCSLYPSCVSGSSYTCASPLSTAASTKSAPSYVDAGLPSRSCRCRSAHRRSLPAAPLACEDQNSSRFRVAMLRTHAARHAWRDMHACMHACMHAVPMPSRGPGLVLCRCEHGVHSRHACMHAVPPHATGAAALPFDWCAPPLDRPCSSALAWTMLNPWH
jgi:hypothetical protein